jgi:hypothetical protein
MIASAAQHQCSGPARDHERGARRAGCLTDASRAGPFLRGGPRTSLSGRGRGQAVRLPQAEFARHRRQHSPRVGHHHLGEHRSGENRRHRVRLGDTTHRSPVRIPELCPQSCVRNRPDHRADPDSTYGRGLFDFNRSIKVAPAFIVGASAGYVFAVSGLLLRPELYVDNLLNHEYLLKGAFFSGASVGRPRTVSVRLNMGV